MNLPILNKQWCKTNTNIPIDHLTGLPEKVIQFGTGVLLRGLPDYYIDKANKKDIFNGRIVVIKSTAHGDTSSFTDQDYLFTHVIRGSEQGVNVDSAMVNTAISRILQSQSDWEEILACAANPNINIILSNTTEQGLVYKEENIKTDIPESFPGKLLALLYHRYRTLGNSEISDIMVIPTELIDNNGQLLKGFIYTGAGYNDLEHDFLVWLQDHVTFCNSLVDRIVPGKPEDELVLDIENKLGYLDNHLILSEPFNLWAIEGGQKVKEILTFAQADEGIKIVEDITVYKELKLRLLNATHILSCGNALLEGHTMVAEAFDNPHFSHFVNLLIDEIKISIPKDISQSYIAAFAVSVVDRFKNPYLRHPWASIILNYTNKIKIRAIPLIAEYYRKFDQWPEGMLKGLAAYFYISMPDKVENDIYFKNIHGTWLKLQDPFSRQLYQNVQTQGKDKAIKLLLEDFLLKDTILLRLSGEIQNQLMEFQPEFTKQVMVPNA